MISRKDYNINAIDIIYLISFFINNLAFVGYFRAALLEYRWTVCQTLSFKILIFLSSLSYFVYGIMIIIANSAQKQVQSYISSTDFKNMGNSIKEELLSQMNNIQNNISTIQNLISLYVFTSFGNICQIISKVNDFDKSSELKPCYQILDKEEKGQKLHHQLAGKIDNMMTQITRMKVMKESLAMFIQKSKQFSFKNQNQSVV